MTQALSPIGDDVAALNEVATVLWEARALYETVFQFMTEDEWLDPLADLVAARGKWCVHLRDKIQALGGTGTHSPLTTLFDEVSLDICRCLIAGDHASAIDHIKTCEERLRETVRQHLDNPQLTVAAVAPLTLALAALEEAPLPLTELQRTSSRAP